MLRYYCLILIFALFIGGCQVQVRYPTEFPSKTTVTHEESYWFWGLVGEKKYEVYDICPQGRVYEILIYSTYMQSTYTVHVCAVNEYLINSTLGAEVINFIYFFTY